jgi:membrane-associated phospholipid phosphatase
LERVKTDCMPSMHTALYFLCFIFVFRYRNIMRWKYTGLIFWSVSCVSLIFSCVYLRYHWVVDVIAGICVAFMSYIAAELTMDRWHVTRESALSVNERPASGAIFNLRH